MAARWAQRTMPTSRPCFCELYLREMRMRPRSSKDLSSLLSTWGWQLSGLPVLSCGLGPNPRGPEGVGGYPAPASLRFSLSPGFRVQPLGKAQKTELWYLPNGGCVCNNCVGTSRSPGPQEPRHTHFWLRPPLIFPYLSLLPPSLSCPLCPGGLAH